MSSRRKDRKDRDLPESLQMFQYFVDLRNLHDGSTRILPLRTMARVFLPTKKSAIPRPREEFLQVEDGAETLEAKTFDDLVTQLRIKYPDGEYERTLRSERDYQTEEAMNKLMDLVVEAVVKKCVRETNGPTESMD